MTLISEASCAHTVLRCFANIARQRGVDISAERLQHDFVVGNEEIDGALMERMAKQLGLKFSATTLTWEHLEGLGDAFPVMVRLRNGNALIVAGFGTQGEVPVVIVQDPLADQGVLLPLDRKRFTDAWTGEVFLLKRQYGLGDEEQSFGLRWVLREILRQKRIFRDIAVAAILLSMMGLALPIFFQLIIDRVLVHQSLGTLYALMVGMIGVIAFETCFSYLRQYMVMHATRKIDTRMNVQVFNKVVNLPMDFFERRPSGEIIKNMMQAERIRNFLTGQLFMSLLDMVSLIIFLPVMLAYSVPMAMLVLGFTLLMALNIGIVIPLLRHRLKALYDAEISQQSFLIENIHGMRTVKSLALDARQKLEWDHRVARSAELRFNVAKVMTISQTISGPLEKLMMATLLGLGSYLALEGEMQMGALIAFYMLAGRVVQPLLQVAQLVQQFQEVSLSVKMLASIMNHPSEQGRAGRGLRVPLRGKVEFQDIRFRYSPTASPALDGVSFTIPEGAIFGIMGRSGSGKTTVTRLLQGLHFAEEGLIRVDGHDLREFDIDHLRSNIGVVLQENFLFTGTIRENVAAAKPGATTDEVMRAVRMAGADEFVERLPKGLDTKLEEGSANLSGGQRQRLAIARALLIDPRVLILDEATSALDAESEAIVQANLMSIARGRTVIIISHRLSSLVPCDAILVMDRGKAVDQGKHGQLLERCGIYQHLWHQQNRHI
ncbi:ATP-binding cassette subfamily B (plasmid) [Azospirillum sp. B510]|uniref:peptidase domain-containing ABC transporter n=2 Tax=Alphaproteobacteria TaxID=28211 RepID=UPI0001C4CD38|nr:peptidase domain-containing ABC transporter [Azospirillum sp. B510]BAI76919.1 ATP-binding cassette subfamily B [Azospirillum sp. B510]